MSFDMIKRIQILKLNHPINAMFDMQVKGTIYIRLVVIKEICILENGEIDYVINDEGDRYNFEYFTEASKIYIYHTIIQNLLFQN